MVLWYSDDDYDDEDEDEAYKDGLIDELLTDMNIFKLISHYNIA